MDATFRRPIAMIAIAVAAFLLAGCAPTPVPNPTAAPAPEPTPTQSPTSDPEPVDPLTTVTAIVVRPEALELRDASDTVVSTLSYDADAATFIGTLSTVLGAEPGQTESEGGPENPPSTEYWWDGVRVFDDHEEPGSIDMNVSILFTASTIGDGVSVATVNGFQPGGDAQALAAELGAPWYGNGNDQVRVESGEPIGEQYTDEYENAYSVAVNTWEAYGSTNAVFAPWNFGIGHV